MSSADEYLTLLDDCEKREERLTDWERDFAVKKTATCGEFLAKETYHED